MNKDSISKDLKLFSQYSCIFVTNSSSGIELKTKVLITDAHQAKYNNSILGLCPGPKAMGLFFQEIFIECVLCSISDWKLLKIKEAISDIGFYYKQRKTHLGTLNYVLWDIQIKICFSICLKERRKGVIKGKVGREKGRMNDLYIIFQQQKIQMLFIYKY